MNKRIIAIGAIVLVVIIGWFTLRTGDATSAELFVSPTVGEFVVDVVTTGELRAKNSKEIMGPQGIREFRINNITIQRLIAEGTIVKSGDFIAELDRSEIMGKMQDVQLDLQSAQSQVTQAQLDSTLELSQARDNLINLKFALEEREIAVDQSKYESPAVQRQAEIELDRAERQLAQETKNYQTKVKQAEARLSEVEAELAKRQNELTKIRELMNQFTIYAPDQGMLIYRRNWDGSKVTEGSQVSAWSPVVAELPDFSVMESVTYINEVDIQKIEVGQNVQLGLDAMADKKLTGEVVDVANIGEQRKNYDSKVFEVVIEVNESDSVLRPAMTTSNKIIIDTFDDVLFAPLEAVHTVDSLNYVFKRSGVSTVMQQVELGAMNENSVIIHRGVDETDQLYLTVPDDTTGISRQMLSDSITQR
jgi:multidrug efflux pump subunit AcrA (membrane-fusion protein)